MFGGYTIYHEPESLKIFNYLKPINKGLNAIARLIPDGVKGRALFCAERLRSRNAMSVMRLFSAKAKKQFFKDYNENHPFETMTSKLYSDSKNYDPITRMQFVDMHHWLNGDLLHNADRTTLAHSLELRTPFWIRKSLRLQVIFRQISELLIILPNIFCARRQKGSFLNMF